MGKSDIKATAYHMFAEKGYHGTTMDEIAASAGITKPTLYYYFKSKADLYFDILNDQADSLALKTRETFERLKGQPLEDTLKAVLLMFIQSPTYDEFLIFKKTVFMASFENDEELKALARDVEQKRRELFYAEIIAELRNQSALPGKERLDTFLLGYMLFLRSCTDWFFLNTPMPDSDYVTMTDNLWSSFWQGSKPLLVS